MKTYIGVLAIHDDMSVHNSLVQLFNDFCTQEETKNILQNFHFIFTGGTFDRIFKSRFENSINPIEKPQVLDAKAKAFLLESCGITRLPPFRDGGVTILAYFITQRLCSITWLFYSPRGHHWRRPENLSLLRLCDQWHVKRLMNPGSVRNWLNNEGIIDSDRNKQPIPPVLVLRKGAKDEVTYSFGEKDEKIEIRNKIYVFNEIQFIEKTVELPENQVEVMKNKVSDIIEYVKNEETKKVFKDMTIALIAHDEMKERMISFAIDHENELSKFGTILATGTTGREVEAATSLKIYRYHSGPKGGDIEMATEILLGRCHIVIFFIDPLNPHPHIDDIRTVFEACMIREKVKWLLS